MDNQFTKPLQGTEFRKFRAEIQEIPEDTPDTNLGWDRPEDMFIPIPQEYVDISDLNTDKRTNDSQKGSTAEHRNS